MATAAETGLPGVMFLMLFFGIAGAKLWPVARARPTETNIDQITLANGIVLSLVGFAVSGQFVSAANLELAYYVTMTGVGLLKITTPEAADATVAGGVVAPPYRFQPVHGAGFPATLPRVKRDQRSD